MIGYIATNWSRMHQVWKYEKSNTTKYGNGDKQLPQIGGQNYKYFKYFFKDKQKQLWKKTNYKGEGTEVAFAQTQDLSEVTFYHCGEKGHYAKTCPEKEAKKSQAHTQMVESDKEDDKGDQLGMFLIKISQD